MIERIIVDGISDRLTHAHVAENRVMPLINRVALLVDAILRIRRVGQLKARYCQPDDSPLNSCNLVLCRHAFEFRLPIFRHAVDQSQVACQKFVHLDGLVGKLALNVTFRDHAIRAHPGNSDSPSA